MASESSKGTAFTEEALEFQRKVLPLIQQEAFINGTDRKCKVVDFRFPEDMKKLFDFEIGNGPAPQEELLDACEKTLKFSVKTAHPRFFNQFYSGVDPYNVTAAWITEAINTNVHTYEVAPIMILMEKYMMHKLCSYVGFVEGEGMFFPGGNIGNMVGLQLGRHHHDKTLKITGPYGHKPLVIFTSCESHYSIKTAAMFMGFGTDHVVAVETDEKSRMKPRDLENKIQECIQQGISPAIVSATAGTTVIGAYDPLDELADICHKYNMWLHVDAAWGGGVLVSEKHKHLMQGVHRADSVLWNLHKMLGAQLQSSVVLVKHKGALQECNGLNANYLFQKDKFYDTDYDIGDMSLQCGRKADAFKNWLMWKSVGMDGIAARVDRSFELCSYMISRLKETIGFRLVQEEFASLNVCFWYIPSRLRDGEETKEWWSEVHKVAPAIKERMVLAGSMMIGYAPLPSRGLVNFFRIILKNPQQSREDVDFVIRKIDEYGKDL